MNTNNEAAIRELNASDLDAVSAASSSGLSSVASCLRWSSLVPWRLPANQGHGTKLHSTGH